MTDNRKALRMVQQVHKKHPLLELYIATTSTISVVLLIVYGIKGVN